jgi:hypothetical protein
VSTLAQNWPRCEHGTPRGRYCGRCHGDVLDGPPATKLTADLERIAKPAAPEPLTLKPKGVHSPRIDRAKGKWTVTCSCGDFRVRSADRHEISAAWGLHRHD